MRNPYEAEPAEEPRVCATCARYFDFDRMCNVPEAVEKLLRERFGIVLGGSEFAVEPEKITDCAAWVSARLIDRYALLRAKQDGKAAARAASAPAARHIADAASGAAAFCCGSAPNRISSVAENPIIKIKQAANDRCFSQLGGRRLPVGMASSIQSSRISSSASMRSMPFMAAFPPVPNML